MAVSGVLLLADDDGDGPMPAVPAAALAAELVGAGLPVHTPEAATLPPDLPRALVDARRVAAIAIWLRTTEVPGPIVVVALGDRSRLLPALALSQRAAGRLVTGYVLLDAPSPAPSMDWPDAPVQWVATGTSQPGEADGALSARLRGFDVVELPQRGEAAVAPVAAVVARAAGAPA